MLKFYLASYITLLMTFAFQTAKSQDTLVVRADSVKLIRYDSLSLDAIRDSVLNILPKKSHVEAALNYLSNDVYLGRKDSAATPYITPTFGYYHKSGLYGNLSASYLATAENRIDLVTVEVGYTFYTGNFNGQFSAVKYWYNSQSFNVRSALKESFSFFEAYDFDLIKPTLTPTLNVGSKLDFALAAGVEHTFYFDDDHLDITPAVTANASTQNYYNSYYRVRKFSVKRKKKTTTVKGSVTGDVLNAARFKMLDYEFTASINFKVKKFTFNFSPVYSVPVNPSVVMITTKIPNEAAKVRTSTEKLGNAFFFQAGLTCKF